MTDWGLGISDKIWWCICVAFQFYRYICIPDYVSLLQTSFASHMPKAQHILPYTFYPKGEGLSSEDLTLIEQAKAATQTSYAPYSNFCVGAALRLENGVVVCGSNQENAAYPAGSCAERTAMFYANAQYPDVPPVAIAVAARRASEEGFLNAPISPCGICRQALIEAETRYRQPIRVLLYGDDVIYELEKVSSLLPFQFDSSAL